MHCGGDGIVECGFLFLDTETCPSCNGEENIPCEKASSQADRPELLLTIVSAGTGRVFY